MNDKTKQELIAEYLKNSEKPFNSISIKYKSENPDSKPVPVSEEDLISALNKLK